MGKLKLIFRKWKQTVVAFFYKASFLFADKKFQEETMVEHIETFFVLQDVAAHYDKMGNVKESSHYSSKSYDTLHKFIVCCEVLKINTIDTLKKYKDESNI